jgi:hypothetical protein
MYMMQVDVAATTPQALSSKSLTATSACAWAKFHTIADLRFTPGRFEIQWMHL